MKALAALLLLLCAPSARAQLDYARETFELIGWREGCSAAVALYGYPALGQGMTEDPVMTKLGTLTIAPGKAKQDMQWVIALHGPFSWREKEVERAIARLRAQGYAQAGLSEPVGANQVSRVRDLPRLLSSTDTLKPEPGGPWPGRGWRWTEIRYNPLATCALLMYERRESGVLLHSFMLARLGNPAARADRAGAHVTNGLLIFELGDLSGAVSELEIASKLSPDNAAARYHHAALLALTGSDDQALDELEAAVGLNPEFKAKARKDQDFETLRGAQRFRDLTRK
jgi:tetratricopeptide (TPR) repeat protein